MMNERGFTLAEMLVVIAVLGFTLAGVIGLQQQGQLAYVMGSNRVDAQQNARVAITLMTREIRGACTISSFSSTAVTFTAVDPTQPSTVDCTGTTVAIRYALSGASIYRDQAATVGALPAIGAGAVLIGGVAGLTLTGYDSQNATTTTAGAGCAAGVICSVDIALTTTGEQSVASYSPGNVRTSLESRVRLRNI